jgi:hypothetical protein
VPGTRFIASAIRIEKPKTEPADVAKIARQILRGGVQRSTNVTTKRHTNPAPRRRNATTASAGIATAARRVAGTVRLKRKTDNTANTVFINAN